MSLESLKNKGLINSSGGERKLPLKILMAASDTFRAAASEQLEIWTERTGCEIIVAGKEKSPKHQKMMWALEYDPDLCSVYEEVSEAPTEKFDGSKAKAKSTRQCGKYERENMKSGGKGVEAALPISVFLVASVLKDKSSKLLAEARGLDDVVKILNDMTGNLDAKKACTGALELHKKYLKKRITYG